MNAPDFGADNVHSTANALVGDLLAAGDGAGFRVEPVAALLGPMAKGALGRGEALPGDLATRRTATEPLSALTRLFLLGLPVGRAVVDRALPQTGTTRAEALGLVTAAGAAPDDEVVTLVDLTPYAADDAEWWLASDVTRAGQPLRADHVLGVGGASTTLARWTPRDPVGAALDIGTGCGVQSFHLARHSGSVVATDTEPRALAFARFNAELNAAWADGPFAGRRLDLRAGSLLEPVAGQRFDLVVSNPPYVITPRSLTVERYTYRDAGLAGDEVVRRLVTRVDEVLAAGGVAQLLGNWEHRRGEPWEERVGGWLEPTGVDRHGLDAWVVQREVQDPAEYAETWARDSGHQPGSPEWSELVEASLRDFADRGVEAIGFGVVTLRRPRDEAGVGRSAVRRLESHPGPVADALGPTVAGWLAAQDWLASASDDDVLGARWRVSGDATEERHHRPGAADPAVIVLRQGGGLRRTVRVDGVVAAAVGASDGELPLGVILGAVAQLVEEPVESVVAQALPTVRELVEGGFLGVVTRP